MNNEFDVRVGKLLSRFESRYGGEYHCYLEYSDAFSLLVATMLSAQCTDARVNMITPALFDRFKDVGAFAAARLEEVEALIHSTGFYHNKAKNIIACAQTVQEKYSGIVPSGIDELTALPGVGRKTANVIRTHIFDIPSIVVDTHVLRVSKRLGLTDGKDPVAVEFDLMNKIPKNYWSLINFWLIAHGRAICVARRPKCGDCFVKDLCNATI